MLVRPLLFASLFLFASLLAGTASAAVATKETSLQRIQRSVARIDRRPPPRGRSGGGEAPLDQLGMPEDSLRARREAWALTYGEIAMVYGFSRVARRQSAALPAQIVEMRREGQDWKAIAKQLGVSIDAVASRVRRNEPRRR